MIDPKFRICKIVYDSSRTIVYMLLFSLSSVLIIDQIKPVGYAKMSNHVDKTFTVKHANLTSDLVKLIKGISIEEVIFRIVPFLLFIALLFLFDLFIFELKSKDKKILFWTIGVISSIGFGYLHGNYLNIFIQGASGMVLWWLLKITMDTFNGLNRYLAIFSTFFLVIFTHFFFDFILIYETKLLLIPIFLNFFLFNYREKWKRLVSENI